MSDMEKALDVYVKKSDVIGFDTDGFQKHAFRAGYTAAQSWCFDMDKAPRDKELLVAGKYGLSVCREYNLFEQWSMKDWENTPVIEPYAWIEVAVPSPKEQSPYNKSQTEVV